MNSIGGQTGPDHSSDFTRSSQWFILHPMNAPDQLPRSPELMSHHDTALLVVDVQGKLASLVQDQANMTWNIHRLIRGAQTLGLPVAGTEQYPEGLGPTVPALAELLTNITSKRAFSCGEIGSLFADWSSQGIHKILLAGIEAHVCIQQTAFDLLSAGFQVYLAVDAISSRQQLDAQVALARLEACGATLTTTEAAMFEWCATSDCPEFKTVSQLVQESPPEPPSS